MFKPVQTELQEVLKTDFGTKVLADMASQGLEVRHFEFFIQIRPLMLREARSASWLSRHSSISVTNVLKFYLLPLQSCGYVDRPSRNYWCLTNRYKLFT